MSQLVSRSACLPPYSVEQLRRVEQSYQYISALPTTEPAPSPSVPRRVLTVALVTALLSTGPVPPRPALASAGTTLSQVLRASNQAVLATTESASFRRLVRQVAPRPPHGPGPDLEPTLTLPDLLDLGECDYHDELDILPPIDRTDLVEVYIVSTSRAEPSLKDLEAEFSYLPDEYLYPVGDYSA